MMPSVSLAMIVKNEGTFLPGCLESVKGMVGEIIIVDTGSTDRTREIAREAGATVSAFAWTGDFSEARNHALGRCTGEWILYLDADERLAPGQAELFSRLVARPRVAAYNVQVRSHVSMQGGGTTVQVMWYPRLFRRGPSVRFEGAVHEQIAPSILRAGGTIEPARLLIEHLGYAQGFEVLRAKAERNVALLRRAVAASPGDWYALYQIGKTHMLFQEHGKAVEHFEAALRCSGVPGTIVASIHNLLGEAALKMGKPGDAIEHCQASLSLFPDQIGVRWFLAGAHMNAGDLATAATTLQDMLAVQSAGDGWSGSVEDVVVPEDAVLELLGKCHAGLGGFQAAAECFFRALQKNPGRESSLAWLIKAHERLARPNLALSHFEKARELVPGNHQLMLLLAATRRQAGDTPGARALLDDALTREPDNGIVYALKASWAAADGDHAGASRILAEAEKRGIVSDELNRCAFDAAFRAGRYEEALNRMQSLTHLLTPEQWQALRERLIALQGASR